MSVNLRSTFILILTPKLYYISGHGGYVRLKYWLLGFGPVLYVHDIVVWYGAPV